METCQLATIQNTIKQMDATTSSAVTDMTAQLNHAEEDIASGDLYAWTYDTIRRFKAGRITWKSPPSASPASERL